MDTNRVHPPTSAACWSFANCHSVGVVAMYLVEVDVVRAEPREGCVDLFENRLARQTLSSWALVHSPPDLRREHDVLAARVPGDRAPDELFRRAELVDVCGIPER